MPTYQTNLTLPHASQTQHQPMDTSIPTYVSKVATATKFSTPDLKALTN